MKNSIKNNSTYILDSFITHISSQFINLEYHEISEAIILGLKKISEILKMERVVIYLVASEFHESVLEWKNHKNKDRDVTTKEKIKFQFPWLINQLEKKNKCNHYRSSTTSEISSNRIQFIFWGKSSSGGSNSHHSQK